MNKIKAKADISSEALNKELRSLSTIKDEIIKKLDCAQKKVVVAEGDAKRMQTLEDEVRKRGLQTQNLKADLANVERELKACKEGAGKSDSTANQEIALLVRDLTASQNKYKETEKELQLARKELASSKQKGPDMSNEIKAKDAEIARLKAASAESLKAQRALEAAQQGTKDQATSIVKDLRKELEAKQAALEKLGRECGTKTQQIVKDCKKEQETIRVLEGNLRELTDIINGLVSNQINAKDTLSNINNALLDKLRKCQ